MPVGSVGLYKASKRLEPSRSGLEPKVLLQCQHATRVLFFVSTIVIVIVIVLTT